MKFHQLCQYFQQIENTSSRLEMEQLILQLFEQLNQEELQIVSYILTERVSPSFVNLEFNLSIKSILKSLHILKPKIDITYLYKQSGDIGSLCENLFTQNSRSTYSIQDIYNLMWKLILDTGTGSTKRKEIDVANLFSNLSGTEMRYISRLISGRLRLGCNDRTIISALSKKLNLENTDTLNYSYGVYPDIGYIVNLAWTKGLQALKQIDIVFGIPISCELVERAKKPEEIFTRYRSVFIQPKYDGLRCQMHIFNETEVNKSYPAIWEKFLDNKRDNSLFLSKCNKKVKLFSRSLEDITHMFPDLVSDIMNSNLSNIILDGEVIGIDTSNDKFISFQDTIKRKRKYGVANKITDIPVNYFVFDILKKDNKSLINTEFTQRFNILTNLYKNFSKDTLIKLTPTHKVSSVTDVINKFDFYVSRGLEGVIVKNPKAFYQPGIRNFEWIKLKKSSNKNFVDTLDVVVLGYYKGTGKRAKFGLGSLLVGIYDDVSNKILTIAKVGTGITEKMLSIIKKECDKYIVPKIPNNVSIPKTLLPDVIVIPKIVCVIEADEISKSDIHTSGYSLRFPRLIEFKRIDKNYYDTTLLSELKK